MKRSRVIHDSDSESEEELKATTPVTLKPTIEEKPKAVAKEVLAPNTHRDKLAPPNNPNSGMQRNDQKTQKSVQGSEIKKKQPSVPQKKIPAPANPASQYKSNNNKLQPPAQKKPLTSQPPQHTQAKGNMDKKRPAASGKSAGTKKKKEESYSVSSFSSYSSGASISYSESSFESGDSPKSACIFLFIILSQASQKEINIQQDLFQN